jgi:hypothetical protein
MASGLCCLYRQVRHGKLIGTRHTVDVEIRAGDTDDLLSRGMIAFVGIAGRFDPTPNDWK